MSLQNIVANKIYKSLDDSIDKIIKDIRVKNEKELGKDDIIDCIVCGKKYAKQKKSVHDSSKHHRNHYDKIKLDIFESLTEKLSK